MGELSGTSAVFSGTSSEPLRIERIIASTIYGKYSLAISGAGAFSIYDAITDSDRLIISSTGAATFSSSVTAGGRVLTTASGNDTFGFQMYKSGSTTTIAGFYQNTTGDGLIAAYNSAGTQNVQIATNGVSYFNGRNVLVNSTTSAYGSLGIGYSFGVKGTNSQTFISIARANQTLDSQGVIVGLDTNSAYFYVHDNIPFTVMTNGTERLKVLSDGPLQFSTIATVPTYNNSIYSYSGNGYMYMQGGTTGLGLAGSGNRNNAVYINSTDNFIAFHTNNAGERMRITSGGNVLMNQTSVIGAETLNLTGLTTAGGGQYGIFLSMNPNSYTCYAMRFFNSNSSAVIGSITMSATMTSYNITSDYRLKEDLKPINGLDIVNKIKVYDYKWKADNSRMDGVLAHELQEVLPYAVTGIKDGEQMQSVDYSKIVPVLIQAIKDQQAQINELKQLINN